MRRSLPSLRRIAFLLLLAACGSRTGLFVDESGEDLPPIADAGPDARRRDSGLDGSEEDEDADALPPLDVRPPIDVDRRDCPDAEATLIYLITTSYQLYSFNPPTGAFKLIGNIVCPIVPGSGSTPFSMAVDRKGVAYILFNDERIYRVSTANAACIETPYVPRQANFRRFGMGFATNTIGPTETLFVSGDEQDNGATGLARIEPSTFQLSFVSQFSPRIRRSELTGTGDGRLFAFYNKTINSTDPPAFIGEINTGTGEVTAETAFPTVGLGTGWAFAFWGGDFYMFTGIGGGSRVTRYRPLDGSVSIVGTLPTLIVGAGVSTCAPQQ